MTLGLRLSTSRPVCFLAVNLIWLCLLRKEEELQFVECRHCNAVVVFSFVD